MSDEEQKREEQKREAQRKAALSKELAELAAKQTTRRNDFLSVLTSLEEAEIRSASCDAVQAWSLSPEHRAKAEATMVRKLRTEHVVQMCLSYFGPGIQAALKKGDG